MADTVKSVFRQREIEKQYQIRIGKENTRFTRSDENNRLVYFCAPSIVSDDKTISDKEIGRYDVEIPILEVGDTFFLHDIQEVVVIKNRMRSSDGSITYYVEDKVMETPNTTKSLNECNERISKWNHDEDKFKDLENELSSCKREFEAYKKEYKYRHRFFNLKKA